MKPFLSFLRRRWFRVLACAFFLTLLLAYAGFKYVLTESFVRARVLPMVARGMRRDVEVETIEGGFVRGFLATGVRFKDPIDQGGGDHITIDRVLIRPDWSELVRGRFAIDSVDAVGVTIFFRKIGENLGNWMPDPRYPQPPGKEVADPFKIQTLSIKDLEYRFVDETSGFRTTLSVPSFAGSLTSNEKVVVAVHGNWVIDSLVFGKPLDQRHIPAIACKGDITTYSREKRTDVRISAFKGDHDINVNGLYDWGPGDSYVRFNLAGGVADLEGEYFRALFPGFIHLEGRSLYSGTVYKGGPDTEIHIRAYTPEAFVKHPGFDGRPLQAVHHTIDYQEHRRSTDDVSSEIVWEATGTLCPLPGTNACGLPFRAALDYVPRDDRMTVRDFRVRAAGVVLDSSGYVWFPDGGRPALGLEGTGTVQTASEAGAALFSFAGIPLDAVLDFTASLQGPAEAPTLIIHGTAPAIIASPSKAVSSVTVSGFIGEEKLQWKEEGGLTVTGTLRGDRISMNGPGADGEGFATLLVEHEILRHAINDTWKVNDLRIRVPEIRMTLLDPFWIGDLPEKIRFSGDADLGGLAAGFRPAAGTLVEGDVSYEAGWEPLRDPPRVTVEAEGAGIRIEPGEGSRECTLDGPAVKVEAEFASENRMRVGIHTRMDDLEVELDPLRRVSLGPGEIRADMVLSPGIEEVDLRDFDLDTEILVLAASPEAESRAPNVGTAGWRIDVTGDLKRLSALAVGTESLAATGTMRVTGRVSRDAGRVSFDGNWNTDLFGFTMPGSETAIELHQATGNQWWQYEEGRQMTLRGVIGAESSLVRSGTREVVLGPAEAGAGISWQEKEQRLDVNRAWLESERMALHLTGEAQLSAEKPQSHFSFDIAAPLEALWTAMAGRSATETISPGTGDLRIEGEFWRGNGNGRAVFRATSDEVWFGSFTGEGALAAQAGPRSGWSWEGDFDIGKVHYGSQVSTEHRYHARSDGDRLWLDKASCTVGGGTVAGIAAADFSCGEPRLSGALWIEDSDLSAWLPTFVTDATGTVGGITSATAVWAARGGGTRELRQTLRADIRLWMKDGYFRRTPTTRSLSSVLGIDELQNVDVFWADSDIHIEGETLYLEEMKMETNHYRAEMEGTLGFDGSQDLRMILNLPIPLARRIPTLKNVEAPIGIKMTGKVGDPKVSVLRYSFVERPIGAVWGLMRSFGKLFQNGNGKPEEGSEPHP